MQREQDRQPHAQTAAFSILYRIVGDATSLLHPTVCVSGAFSILYRIVGDATSVAGSGLVEHQGFQYPLSDRR